jgi:hypothetical protein
MGAALPTSVTTIDPPVYQQGGVLLRHHELLDVALSYIQSSLLRGRERLVLDKRPNRNLQLNILLAVEAFNARMIVLPNINVHPRVHLGEVTLL